MHATLARIVHRARQSEQKVRADLEQAERQLRAAQRAYGRIEPSTTARRNSDR